MEKLAGAIARRRRLVLVAAGLALAGAIALAAGATKRLDPFGVDDPASESAIADAHLQQAGFRAPSVVVLLHGVDPRTAAGRARLLEVERTVRHDPDVSTVAGYLDGGSADFVSNDGRSTYLAVALRQVGDRAKQDAAARLTRLLAGERGVQVGGLAVVQRAVNRQVESDLRRAEIYAFPLLFLLSLLFFRSVVAALLPLLLGGLSIVGALAVLRIASSVASISIFALNVVTGIGLGLAVDYSLFMVSRFREEGARHGYGPAAMARTYATAGRTVAFSALTVAASLASLLVFPQRFLYSMAIGGAAVAVLAAAVSLTVLPALLLLLGERVNAGAPRFLARRLVQTRDEDGAWHRLARRVGRRPVLVIVATLALLVALASPALGLRFTSSDARVLPESATARQVDDALRAEFPPNRTTPVRVVVRGSQHAVERVAARAAHLDGVAAVRKPLTVGPGLGVVDVISSGGTLDPASKRLVRALRSSGADVAVTGDTAHYLDMQHSLGTHLPVVLALVVAITVVLLFAMTGSVVVALLQVVLNALGLGAMYGVLVLLFQHGAPGGLLGYEAQPGLEAPQLLLLFATAFGLSTDYGVFLVARIKELHDAGRAMADAVALGVERTGRLVTAAALLFAVAFGAFLTSRIVLVKELGAGTATAVLVDATVIRALLVPALMHRLGARTWWAPRRLRRVHEALGPSGA